MPTSVLAAVAELASCRSGGISRSLSEGNICVDEMVGGFCTPSFGNMLNPLGAQRRAVGGVQHVCNHGTGWWLASLRLRPRKSHHRKNRTRFISHTHVVADLGSKCVGEMVWPPQFSKSSWPLAAGR